MELEEDFLIFNMHFLKKGLKAKISIYFYTKNFLNLLIYFNKESFDQYKKT